MSVIIGLAYLSVGMMLQTAILSRLPLIHGTVDLILIVLIAWALQDGLEEWEVWVWTLVGAVLLGFISKAPWPLYVITYGIIILLLRQVQQKVWKASVLLLFLGIALATLFQQSLFYGFYRFVYNVPLQLNESFLYIIVPGMVLNLLFAFPVYLVIKDTAEWLHPQEDV